MDCGKAKCETLKEIRRRVARANGIAWKERECEFEGVCKGTCARCEEERRRLTREIERKRRSGCAVKVEGLAIGLASLVPTGIAAEESVGQDLRLTMEDYGFYMSGLVGNEWKERDYVWGISEIIRERPEEVYLVVGHTDERGSEEYRMKLSQRRAEYKREQITACLGDSVCATLIPVGVGSLCPNAEGAVSEEEHGRNRRVEVILLKECGYEGEARELVEEAVRRYMEGADEEERGRIEAARRE